MKIYKKTQYLIFVTRREGKTKAIEVFTKDYKTILGDICWYGPWRKYTFNPAERTTFDASCLDDIKTVMTDLMAEKLQLKIQQQNPMKLF